MTLQGDLSTLQLADLLQSIENGGKTGVLAIEGPGGTRRVYFEGGKLSALAAPGRPALVDVLVASGAVAARALETARRKRKGSRRSLGETLVSARSIDAEVLREIAEARLLDEACELVAERNDAFRFEEGGPPRGMFDAEERRLGLQLASGPLLLESARREDHWRMIRQRVPSDGAHFVAVREPGAGEDELAAALLAGLDGTRSVAEALAAFPHRRFDAYRVLSDLIEAGAVRLARPEDLLRMARERAKREPERAWTLLERALEGAPQERELLVERALLGEGLGKLEEAAEALKVLAHLHLEAGRADEGRARLEDAKRVAPADPAVWEKSYRLALSQGRRADALADGRHLAELYRPPGLHRKAALVLAELTELAPEDFGLCRELAHELADAGDSAPALAALEAFARAALGRGDDRGARAALEEVLRFDAGREDARASIARIDEGLYERRRRRRERLRRSALWLALAALALFAAAREAVARRALAGAERAIARGEWIEAKSYERAAAALEAVARAHPWTSTALFDVPRLVTELRAKDQSAGAEAYASSSARSGASGASDR